MGAALVARIPLPLRAKLLPAFLLMALLLLAVSGVGIGALNAANARAESLADLERKIAAYRQLQNETTSQLYNVASALVTGDQQSLDTAFRQLRQLGLSVERLRFVAADEVQLIARVEAEHQRFVAAVSRVIELVRVGRIAEARALQQSDAAPVADRLERLVNELVNKGEADIVGTIAASQEDYDRSFVVVLAIGLASVALALVLGYAISSSIVHPVQRIDRRLDEIGRGELQGSVEVANRDELGRLAANVNETSAELARLYEQLDQLSRHKSEFLANMSHELRTPLNAIIGFSEVLMQQQAAGPLNPKQQEYLADVLESGRHLLALINDVLDLAKIEAGRLELEVAPFSLQGLLADSLRMVAARAAAHGIALSLDAPGELVIEGDQRKLKQVVINLLSNAVKFTPDGGRVDVTAATEDRGVRVAVRDTGVGVAEEDRERIFEEFRQTRQKGERTREGTGLGLALSKRYVELHGGRIWLDSEVGAGSTFTFTIPASQRDPATDRVTR